MRAGFCVCVCVCTWELWKTIKKKQEGNDHIAVLPHPSDRHHTDAGWCNLVWHIKFVVYEVLTVYLQISTHDMTCVYIYIVPPASAWITHPLSLLLYIFKLSLCSFSFHLLHLHEFVCELIIYMRNWQSNSSTCKLYNVTILVADQTS